MLKKIIKHLKRSKSLKRTAEEAWGNYPGCSGILIHPGTDKEELVMKGTKRWDEVKDMIV